MKKTVCTVCCVCLCAFLFCASPNANKIDAEKQFAYYLYTLRNTQTDYAASVYQWADRLSRTYGAELLPLIDTQLRKKTVAYRYLYRVAPTDNTLDMLAVLLGRLKACGALTKEKQEHYRRIYEQKLERYVFEYCCIDATVFVALKDIADFCAPPDYCSYTATELKRKYEKELGIKNITVKR